MLKLFFSKQLIIAASFLVLLLGELSLVNAQWYSTWNYRCQVTVSNPAGNTLTDFQIKINLDNSNFNFANAKADGSDLRITGNDALTLLPFWLEKWDSPNQSAIIWVKIPSIPVSGTTIYVYYGNEIASSSADGDNTFDFFDDFSSVVTSAPGYYTFGPASTIMVQESGWGESSAPHTLSVVRAPSSGAYNNYTYYGYYGPQSSGYLGIAGSNDLITWTRFPYNPPPNPGINNPLFTGNGVRWPSVYFDNNDNKYYMVHTLNYGSSYIVYRESTDGLTWSAPTTIVPYDVSNQNPSLFHDPVSGKYYLYWYRAQNGWSIMAREATTVAGLVTATNQLLINSPVVLAAPQVLYYDNTYFLSTEILEGVWKVRIYSGSSPLGPFTVLPGNPVLVDGCACLFQHLFNGNIYEYYCKETSGTWTLDMRVVNPSTGRIIYEQGEIDNTKWTPDGGTWNVITGVQPNGEQGLVAQGITGANAILKSTFSGSDYVLEGYGKQISSRVWGFGIRTTNTQNTYTLNLYEDLDATNNLYFYRWLSSNPTTTVWNTSLGTISSDTWYKLMVKAHSNNFDIYFNDALRTSTTDNSFASGSIALYGESGTVAHFDDIRVRKYASVEPTSVVGGEETNPLPVELSAFSATPIGSAVKINWITDTEVNNYGFEIERKSESNWEKIGFVAGNGNSNSPKNYSFTDSKPVGGNTFKYRLKQIDNDGQFEYSSVIEVEVIPNEFTLYQNYPNPFNPLTKIRYQVPKQSKVVIKIYNILGSEVLELLNENKEPGIYEVNFDASFLSSGTYIYKIIADEFVQTKKMILLK